jgi:hypothetical protein
MDGYRGVVPTNRLLGGGLVVVGGLVEEVGKLTEDKKSVREAWRNPELTVILAT